MNALRTASFGAARAVRFFFVLIGVLALTGLAGMQAAPGGTGQALALQAALRAASLRDAAPSAGAFTGPQRTPAGRTLIDPRLMRSGALRKKQATTSSTVPIPGAVQTFDLFNPPPAFRPLIGYAQTNMDGSTTVTNNTTLPPLYLNHLTPLNLTPVWSNDETFIVFSSDRTLAGGIQPDGRFHLWAISVNGGEAYQITTSTGPASGGEFFPALVSADNRIAFTSDSQSPGHQNLYAIPFSFSVLVGNNNAAATLVDVSPTGGLSSYTIRTDAFAVANGGTGFDQVQRPTFSPSNNDLVVFSAHSTAGDGTYGGHNHIYYLYLGTGGYDPVNTSLPAKLTDGPAEDTDPAYSPDGQFIAFASTATQVVNQTYPASTISSNPNTSQTLTQNVDPGNLRNLFLISGGGGNGVSSPGLGTVPTSLQGAPYYGRVTTTAGTDNYGPAWSATAFNQYTNNAPGFEYLAFARGSSPLGPHDIYYLQTIRSTNQAGESAKSDEAATTPDPAATTLYEINAGGPAIQNYVPETYNQFNLQQNVTLNVGGVAGQTNAANTPPLTFNQTNDTPGTPAGIYQTARTGQFGYVIPNLTPGATYTLRFHFADPTSTAVGQRTFNVFVNQDPANQFSTPDLLNYDIFAHSNAPTRALGGEVTSAAAGAAPIAGATVRITNLSNNAATTLTTTAVTTGPDGQPLNYTTNTQNGTYSLTVSAPGYNTVSREVVVNNAAFTRADFSLSPTATDGTLSGSVTDTGTGIPATITVNVDTGGAIGAVIGAPVADDPNTGAYSVALPAGTYFVTATPAAGSGETTLTQTVTITAATPATLNFALTSGANAGTAAGMVTDSATNRPIPGGTVRVTKNGVVVAIVTTSGTPTTTGPAPTGDGRPANYSLLLPVGGGYTFQFTAPGYMLAISPVTVVNSNATSFVRADKALVLTATATTGQIPVVVALVTAQATTAAQTNVNTSGGVVPNVAPGSIVISFANSNPAAGTPILEGLDVLANTDATQSSGFGALNASNNATAPPLVFNPGPAIGGDGLVTLSFQAPAGFPPVSFNIYRSTITGASLTSVNQPGAGSATEGNIPYYTNIPYDPTLTFQTFVDSATATPPTPGVTNGTEYYYQVTAVYAEQLTPEGKAIPTGQGTVANAVIKLNTDDNPTPATLGGSYDDVYPSWSPFHSIFSIAYESGSVRGANPLSGNLNGGVVFGGRTVTYNDPATGYPSETAVSVGAGGTVASTTATGGYSVAASYIGLFQSQVLNLDPPTLLRFSTDEILHVQAATTNPVTGTPTKTGINPGAPVTITVRLSDREAGIDNGNSGFGTGGADATKPQVFLQIKDPDSKYQDARQLEHKVFARDSFYNTQTNRPANDITSGSANEILSLDDGPFVPGLRDLYPTFGGLASGNQYVAPRGAHGGFYQQTGNNPTPTTIFVGKNGGGTNKQKTSTGATYPGTNPDLFLAWGPEYECQFLNPLFATGSGQNAPLDASDIDYGTPFYLAGVDDQQPFSGEGKQRPTTNTAAVGNTPAKPAEWLQMSRVPDAQQDHLGGVLYTVTWTTPATGSDFYLDVIAFDKAVFPSFPPLTSSFSGGKVNWRIYDNIGGFSTQASIGNNDILVVSDYALGQKFAATTFGGTNGNLNLVPKLYGAEAAITDVDVNVLPDSVYAGYPFDATVGVPGTQYFPAIQAFIAPWFNGLGVGSYNDNIIDDGGRQDGAPSVNSQKYSIWRILSRGPLPQSILNSYLPTKQTQPAVQDLQSTNANYRNIPAGTVLDAHKCVIWVSPYTGDLLTDPGTIDDPGAFNRPGAPDRQSTQTILRNFVQGGGRLFVTGQDVGSTLTTGGTVANGAGGFLSDVLNASLTSTGGGTFQLQAGPNRITNYPTYDGSAVGTNGNLVYPIVVGDDVNGFGFYPFSGPAFGGEPYRSRLEISGAPANDANFASDGSLSQRASFFPSGANLLGQPDTLNATNGATAAITYTNGSAALVYHDDPYNPKGTGKLPNGGTGGRTVYAGFGMEALSNDAYSSDGSNPATTPFPYNTIIPTVASRNPRANILHNIVGFLRTGSVTGIITQTAGPQAGAGAGVSNVTVYLIPANGAPAPASRATFSATTQAGAFAGHFTIIGVEPGTYRLAAYAPGYASTISNANLAYLVEGDATTSASLTITQEAPGNIEGNVHDTSLKPVIGATVSFLSKDKTIVKSTTTFDGTNPAQPAGNYFLPTVPVADYTGSATGPNNPSGKPEYLAAAAPDPVNSTTLPGTTYATDVNVLPSTTTGDGSTAGGPPVAFTLTPILPTVSGRIYDATVGNTAAGGANVSGATITLLDGKGNPVLDALGNIVTTQAAADGTYTLKNIPAGQTATVYTVSVAKAGYSTGTFAVTVYLGDILTGENLGLTPIPPGAITGTVTDQGGNPVPNATVTFKSADGTTKTATTDGQGSFTLAGPSNPVPPGTYSGTAVGPLNPNGRPVSSSSAAQTVTVISGKTTGPVSFVVMTIPPSFSGKTIDSAGNPLANVVVYVYDSTSGALIGTTISATDGTYSTANFAIPPGGTYTVTASLAGYSSGILRNSANGTTKFTEYDGDALAGQNITLTAQNPGEVVGIVRDTAGKPIAGATVTITSVDKTATYSAVTLADGTYTIMDVLFGSYTATATGPAPGSVPEYTAATKPDAPFNGSSFVVNPLPAKTTANPSPTPTGPVDFTLVPILPTVTGKVTDSTTTTPLGNVKVTFTPTAGGDPFFVTTNAGGIYVSPSLPAGTYSVTASAATGYFDLTQTVTLTLGETVTLNFALLEKATLIGYVTDAATGLPVLGATLTVKDATTGIVVATTPTPLTTIAVKAGPDGSPINYSGTLAPGTYTVTVTKSGYATQTSAKITLTNGPFGRLDFKLISAIGTLGGLVTDSTDTTPVAGATVTVANAAGTVVAIFTTAGTASSPPPPNGDGNPLNYSGQITQGTYTVTVTQGSRTSASQTINVIGGQFNRLNFTGTSNGLAPLHTFPGGRLNFLSLPYDYSAVPFDTLFGNLNTSPTGTQPNGNRSHVAVWNPLTSAYALDPNYPADALRPGVGYWVYLKNPVSLTTQGAAVPAPNVAVPLHAYWNQIGVPSVKGVPVSALMFDNGQGGMITFAQAISSTYHVVSPTLYSYDGTGYQPVVAGETLQPYQAYWIKVYADATLEIPSQ